MKHFILSEILVTGLDSSRRVMSELIMVALLSGQLVMFLHFSRDAIRENGGDDELADEA